MSLLSWIFCLFLAAGVPWLSARSMAGAVRGELSRRALYLNACASLWGLAAIGYLVLKLDGDTLASAGLVVASSGFLTLTWGVMLAAAALGLFAVTQILRAPLGLPGETAGLRGLRPQGRLEAMVVLLLVAPTAGLCEEFLYRGLLLSRLEELTGSVMAAALISSGAFGAAHAYQGWLGALRAGVIGLLLVIPVAQLGSLLPAIIAHGLVDAAGMLWLWPLLDRPVAGAGAPPGLDTLS